MKNAPEEVRAKDYVTIGHSGMKGADGIRISKGGQFVRRPCGPLPTASHFKFHYKIGSQMNDYWKA